MKNDKWKSFVIPFVLTIIIYRIFLFLISQENFQYNDGFHHAYIGMLILFITGLIYKIRKKINIIFFGIGLGMLIDEILLIFSNGTNGYQKYWNNLLIYGTFILMIIIIMIYFVFSSAKKRN